MLKQYHKLSLKRKMVYAQKDHSYQECFRLHCYDNTDRMGLLGEYNKKTGRRNLEEFDYMNFLNKTE